MKTFITIIVATVLCHTPGMAAVSKHEVYRHAVDLDYYALNPNPSRNMPASDGCIGLSSGTSSVSCGATLSGGPSGGLN